MRRLTLLPLTSLTPVAILCSVVVSAFLLTILLSGSAQALSFQAGRIIDDSVFTDENSMSATQIQSFLNSKVPSCDTNGEEAYGSTTRAEYGTSRGYPPPYTCLRNYTQNGKTAAGIIYEAAQDYDISPKTLLVLLQKEQGLVTDDWPWTIQYRSATGYGCPDGAECDSDYYGFTNQVRWAARMFRAIMDNDEDWYTPYDPGSNVVYWNPDRSRCGSSTIKIENRATAALYNYTPYRPNQAALDAGYGTGNSCSSYGNRNFFLYFRDWFGSTTTNNGFRFIACDGNDYLIERGIAKKRLISDEAMIAWNFSGQYFAENDPGCSYPAYDLALTMIVRSRDSGKTYLVDNGKAYYIANSDVSDAWDIDLSQDYAQVEGSNISDTLTLASTLPRVVTSTNPDITTAYLIDDGARHPIAGTSTEELSSLRLLQGSDSSTVPELSVNLLVTLPSATPIDYAFQSGGNWYLLDYGNVKRISSEAASIWDEYLSGPELSSAVFSLFNSNITMGSGFQRSSYYYHAVPTTGLERTMSPTVARYWGVEQSPFVSDLLKTKLMNDMSLRDVYGVDGNVRLIECSGQKYLVERNRPTKRQITADGLEAWDFADKYFVPNDKGCGYPTYDLPADDMLRSRSSGKLYYLMDGTAYYVQSQEAADDWNLGDIDASHPQFDSASILDNLEIVRQLPPHEE